MPVLSAVLLATALSPGAVPAPSAWPAPGETVRVAAAGEGWQRGVVVAVEGGTLLVTLGRDRAPTRLSLSRLDRLEVARGRRSAAREGALYGGLAGAALGALGAAALGPAFCDGAANCGTSGEGTLVLIGSGAAAGAAVGGLVGLAIKQDRWERVSLDRVRVGLGPLRGGAGLQLSARW